MVGVNKKPFCTQKVTFFGLFAIRTFSGTQKAGIAIFRTKKVKFRKLLQLSFPKLHNTRLSSRKIRGSCPEIMFFVAARREEGFGERALFFSLISND